MKDLIKKWENELQFEVDENNTLDYWVFEITTQPSRFSWYGLKYVWITEYVLENGDIYYVIEVEDAAELVKQDASDWEIENALVERNHKSGDFTIEKIFRDKEAAYKFVNENYPKIDVEKEVNEILNSKK